MTPVGVELDAAVLKAIGKEVRTDADGNVDVLDGQWWSLDTFKISADHNGHEALRLCGPWLRERELFSQMIEGWNPRKEHRERCWIVEILRQDKRDGHWEEIASVTGDTLAHALCLAVLAIAEREGT